MKKTYILLVTFTPRGIEQIKDSPDRAARFTDRLRRAGCAVKGVYWTFGSYDGVLIFEAPDDRTAHTAILELTRAGNITAKTLDALTGDAFKELLAGLTEK